ncbi:MAG TPA: hypothetical protein VL860_01715 [Planctomycetota bacterium]|nr:hypothetical protein [Planctomycetota bacterium]
MRHRGWFARASGVLRALCLAGLLGGCGVGPDSTTTVDELGYGPAGRTAILRQAIDSNDQTYLYSRQGQLVPVRLADRTQGGIAEQWGALEYEPLAYLLRRALLTNYAKLAEAEDPAAGPIATSESVDASRIFNQRELDRGRKVVRTTAVIGSLGFLKPDDVRVEGGIALSRRFGIDLHRYFVIYGIAVRQSGEIFGFYMPVPVAEKQFTKVYEDLMEKQHSFTIIDFAGWYYKHQAFVSQQPDHADHYWVLPTLVGPVPNYTAGDRYPLGPQEEQQLKWVAERPLSPKGGEQVYHRAVFEFVSGKAQGFLRHDGQLLLTPDQVFNALVADSMKATPDGKAPQMSTLSVVVIVDRDDAGTPPNLGQLKDALDLIATQKVAWIFVKVLHEPGPAALDLEALRAQWLEEKAARDAARKAATPTPPAP